MLIIGSIVVSKTIYIRLKDLLDSPTEVKAFELLRYIDAHKREIPRGGLEGKALQAIDDTLTAKQIQKACMALRDTMVSNGNLEHACVLLTTIEVALHKEAKRRKVIERRTRAIIK